MGNLSYIGEASNGDAIFLESCPYWLLFCSPAIQEIANAYDWREKNSLQLVYPKGISVQLKHALDYFTRGVQKGLKEKYDEAKRKSKV